MEPTANKTNNARNISYFISDKIDIGVLTQEKLSQTKSDGSYKSKQTEEKIEKLFNRKTLLFFSSVFAFLFGGSILFFYMTSLRPYKAWFNDYRDLAGISAKLNIEEGMKEYLMNGDYEFIVDKINTVEEKQPLTCEQIYYRALSYLKLIKYEKGFRELNNEASKNYAILAIKDLEYLQKTETELTKEVNWNLAMAYLAEKRIVDCYNTLSLLEGTMYEKPAFKIKKKLKTNYEKYF